jgi:hypothetical protein
MDLNQRLRCGSKHAAIAISKKVAGVDGLEPTTELWFKTNCSSNIKKMAGVDGLEPTNDGIKTRCLTTWLYPNGLKY